MNIQPLKIVYFTSNGSDVMPVVSAVSELAEENPGKFEICLRSREDLAEDGKLEEFLDSAREANIIIMHFMGGKKSFPNFDGFMAALEGSTAVLHLQGTASEKGLELAQLSTLNEADYQAVSSYIHYGGKENFLNLFRFLSNRFSGSRFDVAEACKPQWQGIYHPDFPGLPSLEEYLKLNYKPDRPSVGLWFYLSAIQSGNTEFIDALIREIEGQGANVIPVFLYSIQDNELGSQGTQGVIEHYFIKDGRPLIDVLISPLMFALSMWVAQSPDGNQIMPGEDTGLLTKLGVPVIKAIVTQNTAEKWQQNTDGLTQGDVTMSVAMPEFDGMLISVPVAARQFSSVDPLTGTRIVRHEALPERINKIVRLSLNWARLSHIPNGDKKVAIIFHNYPPRNDKIGNAFGLDSPASVWNILHSLQEAGYKLDKLPENGQEIIETIIDHATNDRRWKSLAEMAGQAAGLVSKPEYSGWFSQFPQKNQSKMASAWGDPPGEPFNCNDSLIIPGIINGNIFIGLQPPRGFSEDPSAIYHSPDHPPTHHYLAYYRWIRDVFKANVIMHIGKHGSLEWLPGKSVGLSDECFPDLAISDLPNIYPYIINNPGEGTQAKRRSYCCIIDHLIPVMHNAGSYEEMAELQVLLNDYYQSGIEDRAKLPELRRMIWAKTLQAKLEHDLAVDEEIAFADFEAFIEKLHSYLHEMEDTQIRDGLHILGEPPQGERLAEFLAALTRLSNGEVPSLRKSLAAMQGYDYDALLASPGRIQGKAKTGGQIIAELSGQCVKLIARFQQNNFSHDDIEACQHEVLGQHNAEVSRVLAYLSDRLVPNLMATTGELDSVIKASGGKFIPPGPSGAPTRGMADILPTGRNFYSVDPQSIPSAVAWKTGMGLGDALLERYFKDEGKYPENIGMVVWATGTMRTKGDDVAEVLYLMGMKPVWEKSSGRVKGIEVIPLKELGRPRIDITIRISGLFRDAFPNIVSLLDEAVNIASSLDEPPEMNYLAKHVRNEIAEKTGSGISAEQAGEEARYRIFGCKPGAYGAGVSNAIESKNWKDEHDLAKAYLVWGGYAYGKKYYGVTAPEQFKTRLGNLELTVKNEDNREHDMLDSDDFYSYHGGMIAAVKAIKGEWPQSYAGDSSDPERVKIRSTAEETKHIFRARVLNPVWIESMKRHGYKGAADFSAVVDNAFGWDASANVMEDWMYEELANKYALDSQMQEWLKDVNPYALQNITERLLEAIQRQMWQASPEMETRLKQVFLEVEGSIEEDSAAKTK
ncbi:MAG: cobaltochelatase subunit CobN [Dehalococcoides mccartyi]|uniref:cobaltochelatase subunit CobN n=1 Tax=Dehalococcoides mccartyi TaxID=61435 RepID=UPI0030F725B3